MAEMGIAASTVDFRPTHKELSILSYANGLGFDGLVKTGPASATFELGCGIKNRFATANTREHSSTLFIVEGAGKGTLGAMLTRDVKGCGRQLSPPFSVRFRDFGL